VSVQTSSRLTIYDGGVRVALLATAIALSVTGAATSSTPSMGCTPARTTALVNRFLAAFDRGDREVLDNDVWGRRLYFNWYSVTSDPGARLDPDARRRDTLMDYFAARHAAGERLVLVRLTLHGVTAGAYRNFEFRLLRSADDQAGGQVPYSGKGAASCATGRLTTWAMGR
jgi:hypothetical protein